MIEFYRMPHLVSGSFSRCMAVKVATSECSMDDCSWRKASRPCFTDRHFRKISSLRYGNHWHKKVQVVSTLYWLERRNYYAYHKATIDEIKSVVLSVLIIKFIRKQNLIIHTQYFEHRLFANNPPYSEL